MGLDYFYTVLVRDAQRNVQNYKPFQYSTDFLPTILLMEILTIKVEMADTLLQKIMIASSAPSFRQNSVGENTAIDLIGRASSTDNQPIIMNMNSQEAFSSQFNSVVYLGDSKLYKN